MKEGFGQHATNLEAIVKQLTIDVAALTAEVKDLTDRVDALEQPEEPADTTPPTVDVTRPS